MPAIPAPTTSTSKFSVAILSARSGRVEISVIGDPSRPAHIPTTTGQRPGVIPAGSILLLHSSCPDPDQPPQKECPGPGNVPAFTSFTYAATAPATLSAPAMKFFTKRAFLPG